MQRSTYEAAIWVLDTTFPFGWDPEYRKTNIGVSDFANGFSDEMKAKVRSRWEEYGYGHCKARKSRRRAVCLRG